MFLPQALDNTQPASSTETVPVPDEVKSGRFEDGLMSVNIRFTRNVLGKISSFSFGFVSHLQLKWLILGAEILLHLPLN